MSKIIIIGYPHSGTSILKTIVSHIDNVEHIIDETKKINIKTDKKFIVCKWPFALDEFFTEEYKDYKKIFIIRNPLFIFSSLNKRLNYKIPHHHNIDRYINTLKKFIFYRNNKKNNIYTIRYEDLFEDNFKQLKDLLNSVGLKYNDDIFINENYQNYMKPNVETPIYKPKNSDHVLYRTWQLNQPFESQNLPEKIDLLPEQSNKIINNPTILKVYPNIKSLIA